MIRQITELEPKQLWHQFNAISQIPHPSGNLNALREYIMNFAQECGYLPEEDAAGNILVRLPILDVVDVVVVGFVVVVVEVVVVAFVVVVVEVDFVVAGFVVVVEVVVVVVGFVVVVVKAVIVISVVVVAVSTG